MYEGKDGAIEDIITGKRVLVTANLIDNGKYDVLVNLTSKLVITGTPALFQLNITYQQVDTSPLQEKLANHRS